MTEDPKRLIDSPDESALVRDHLQVAAGRSPVPYDVGGGLRQLEAGLDAGSAGAGSSTAWWSSPWTWVAAVGMLASAYWLTRPDTPVVDGHAVVTAQADEAKPSIAEPEERVPPAPEISGETPSSHDATPEAPRAEDDASSQPDAAPVKTTRRKSKAPSSPAGASDGESTFEREMRMMAAARKALARDPGETLRLTERAAKEFPKGFFAEERDALNVLALVGLGRDELAQKQAKAFLRRYPSGTFSEKVRQAAPPSSDQ